MSNVEYPISLSNLEAQGIVDGDTADQLVLNALGIARAEATTTLLIDGTHHVPVLRVPLIDLEFSNASQLTTALDNVEGIGE